MTSLPQLNFQFSQPHLLEKALTHKSFFNENLDKSSGHNEKLEFLGDSVLDLAVSSLLMSKYPEFDEGALSKVRASLVNEDSLSEVAKSLGLEKFIRLGRGETKMNGAAKPRLQASCLEAIVGAMYLDGGYLSALAWVEKAFAEKILKINLVDFFETDYKTTLQEKLQKQYKVTPQYQLIKQEGPDHDKIFSSEISVPGLFQKTGTGKSKKASEQDAARKALEEML